MAHTGLSRKFFVALASAAALLAFPHTAASATYNVGPGQTYATPSAVPWESLQPGDQVLIHWRATPYQDKWVICRAGHGGRADRRPRRARARRRAADHRRHGATTRLALDYWSESAA